MTDSRDQEIKLCNQAIKQLGIEHPLAKRNLQLETTLKNIWDNRHDDEKIWELINGLGIIINGSEN